jgi:glyoxylase-like metal-dependent hydrolase (beta-lactamase superfamily II)
MRRTLIGVALTAGLVAGIAATTLSVATPAYQVYAVQYGVLVGYPMMNLVLGADSTKTIDASMMFWVARGGGRILLVDAGFYREEFRKAWKIKDFVKPSEAVAKLGIKPEEVTDIVLSHLHWDHTDGADLFPRAKVWVQRREMEHYRDPKNQVDSGVFPVDIAMLDRIAADGRFQMVDGDSQAVAPGVFVYVGGRHTWESQYVSVPTASGTVVLASDNLYLYENLDRRRPITATFDTLSNLAAQDRMRRLAGSLRLVVPGHDPQVLTRFPMIAPGVVAIR